MVRRFSIIAFAAAGVIAACPRGSDGQAGALLAQSGPTAEVLASFVQLAAADAGAATGPSPPSAASRTLRFQPSVIVDATGFEQPMGATSIFIPHGWQTQGGVAWGREYACTNGYAFNWLARSPDGSSVIAVLPGERWESNNYGAAPSTPGCGTAPYTNVRQYIEALARKWRPGARALDYRPREDLQREFAHMNSSTQMPAGGTRTWVEAGEALIAFSDRGREMRGSVAAVAVFTHNRADYGTGPMVSFIGHTFPAYAVAAPNGQLNLGYFEAIRRTMKPNPVWQKRIAGHNTAIGQVALEESIKRGRIVTESREYMTRLQQETWNASQESADRRAREFGEAIKGVETYDDANAPGGTVELSQTNHAWRLNDGTYVLTDDPNFDPWRDLQMEGRQLEATP